MFVFQMFESVGMTMGIMPVTGIPLPFMSYGGSSTLSSFAAIGLVLNVHMRRFSLIGHHELVNRCRIVSGGLGAGGQARATRYPVTFPGMNSIWPQLEPLLAQVQKPARYIGCEDGAQRPDHAPRQGRPGCCIYPDTYEIGLPNQGLQILYEILNERPDAVAERSYAPWTDLEALLRPHELPLFSVDTHRPAGEFDLLAFNVSAELVYTNLLNCIDLAGVPVRAADRRPERPADRGRRPLHLQPRAAGRFRRLLRARRRRGGRERDHRGHRRAGRPAGAPRGRAEQVLRAPRPRSRASTCRRCTRSPTRAPTWWPSNPATPTCPSRVEKRTIADLGDWPYPKNQLVPLTEVVHDRLNVEVFRGCTRGCRFCQAGMITRPVRERPAEQVRTMIDAGLPRTGYDEVALTSLSTADFTGIEKVVTDTVNVPTARTTRSRSRCRRCGSTRSPSASPRRSRRPAAPASRSRPRPARGACAR